MSEICRYLGLATRARDHAAAVLALPAPGASRTNRISASAWLARLTQPAEARLATLADLLQEARDAADAQLEGEVLCAAGDAAAEAGQCQVAHDDYREALTIAQDAGEVHLHVDALSGVAATGHMLRPNRDNLADAVAAGELAADNGLRIRHSQCLTVQAQIHIGLGNRTPALRAAQTAVQIQRTAGALALLAHTQELVNRLKPARTHTADQPRQRKCCLG